MSTNPRYALIVTIEGLGTNLVGCYGGAIAPTKNLDSFACRSIVFDQFWSDTMRPVDILESMWTGKHFAARNSDPSVACNALFERAILITDSVDVVEESTLGDFGSVLLVEGSASDDETSDPEETGDIYDLCDVEEPSDAEEISAPETSQEQEQTEIARLFETALGQWATQMDEFPILWIHSRGLNGKWDAPYEYRCVMCDEGDPEPPFETSAAELRLSDETDPDEVFGLACSMGAQSMVLDDAWSMVEEFLEQLGVASDCLQVLAGVQGYPIGEHGWVGHGGKTLYAESLHLPLVVRPGDGLNVGVRVPFMVQPNSILKTLVGWMDEDGAELHMDVMTTDLVSEIDALPAEHWPTKNNFAYACAEGQVHVAVPAWSCRWSRSSSTVELNLERVELFATPDDRWQQNEVSQRAQSIVEELTERRDAWLRCCEGAAAQWPALSSDLTHPIR